MDVQSRLERLTDGEGHASVDGTIVVTVLLKALNWMTDDEMIWRPEMQLKYAKTNSNADGEEVILVCCHKLLMAAPIPFHAPTISCTAVSIRFLAMTADNTSCCVISTRTVVYIYPRLS